MSYSKILDEYVDVMTLPTEFDTPELVAAKVAAKLGRDEASINEVRRLLGKRLGIPSALHPFMDLSKLTGL